MAKKVTNLSVQKRNPNRVNVYLDGEFAFGLARIVAAWLTVGQELSPEKIDRLKGEDAAEVALQRAIRFLGFRPRSVTEVEKNLKKHETPENTIQKVIERLERNGMLDDRKFAKLWVENRSEFRPLPVNHRGDSRRNRRRESCSGRRPKESGQAANG
jgi:regulatory protein